VKTGVETGLKRGWNMVETGLKQGLKQGWIYLDYSDHIGVAEAKHDVSLQKWR
jgi:hypothetical protein